MSWKSESDEPAFGPGHGQRVYSTLPKCPMEKLSDSVVKKNAESHKSQSAEVVDSNPAVKLLFVGGATPWVCYFGKASAKRREVGNAQPKGWNVRTILYIALQAASPS